MALKRKRCGASSEKRLYMAEFFVDRLNLYCNKPGAYPPNPDDFYVRVGFLDLTPFDVSVQESTISSRKNRGAAKDTQNPITEKGDLTCGACCLFRKTVENLVQAIATTPLSIEVRRQQTSSDCCAEQIVCQTKVPLPTCLCEHVASLQDAKNGSPAPYLVRSMYHLTDLRYRSAGYVSISLRLWCLGEPNDAKVYSRRPLEHEGRRCCVEFNENTLSGQNGSNGNCGQNAFYSKKCSGGTTSKSMVLERIDETCECEDVSVRGPDKKIPEVLRSMLKRPATPPRISMDEPGFASLTSAEKLNDPQYRGMIYSCYPDEPTCSCRPPKRARHPMACGGGCSRICCSRLRNPESVYQQKECEFFMPSHCIDGGRKNCDRRMRAGSDYIALDTQELDRLDFKWYWTSNNVHNVLRIKGGTDEYFDVRMLSFFLTSNNDPGAPRIREPDDARANVTEAINLSSVSSTSLNNVLRLIGGGMEDYSTPSHSSTKFDTEYNWCGDAINSESRLGGGGEASRVGCTCTGPAVKTLFRDSSTAISGEQSPCRPSQQGASKASCVCPGKEPTPSTLKGSEACTKKPCSGIDCLLRTFQDLQDFVDSFGKVPGLAGLGLMDPSESPYFGRNLDKDYAPQEPLMSDKRKGPHPNVHNPQCTAPCSQIPPGNKLVAGVSTASIPYGSATPFTIAVPGRTGVVREAIPALPDTNVITIPQKVRRKEEKKKEKDDEKAKEQKELDASALVPLDVGVGPCGEPRCKSRKKGADVGAPSSEQLAVLKKKKSKTSGKKVKTGLGKAGSKSSHKHSTHKLKGKSSAPGPGGDQARRGDRAKGSDQTTSGSQIRRGDQTRRGDQSRGGDQMSAGEKTPVTVGRKIMRWVYSLGDIYPGVVIGHKNCVEPRIRVPANMGWLWNTNITVGKLKPRLGWKPGAITRFLSDMLRDAKLDYFDDDTDGGESRYGSKYSRGGVGGGGAGGIGGRGGRESKDGRPRTAPSGRARRNKMSKSMSSPSVRRSRAKQKKEVEEEVEAPPTLHIHRKDGTYYVTMYPIKQEISDGVPRIDEPMKPLQFKIVKNKDDASIASSSTASDMEIEFSPPAAVNRNRRRPDVIHVDTQVRQQQIIDAIKATDPARIKEKKLRKENERKEKERKEKEKKEKEKKDKDRKEKERRDKERRDKERMKQDKLRRESVKKC